MGGLPGCVFDGENSMGELTWNPILLSCARGRTKKGCEHMSEIDVKHYPVGTGSLL